MTRPLLKGNKGQSQLSHPSVFSEADLDCSKYLLFSLVAWDHVSWPGNDFYAGMRATDDGVKAAATDSMFRLTAVEGHYSRTEQAYLPPEDYWNWNAVVARHSLQLRVKDNLFMPAVPDHLKKV